MERRVKEEQRVRADLYYSFSSREIVSFFMKPSPVEKVLTPEILLNATWMSLLS